MKRKPTFDKSIQCDSVLIEPQYLSCMHSPSQDVQSFETSCAGCSFRNLKSVSQSRNNSCISYFPPPLSDSGDSGVFEDAKDVKIKVMTAGKEFVIHVQANEEEKKALHEIEKLEDK